MKIQQADPDQFDAVLELLSGSVEWLRGKGLDQWSTWESWRTKMKPSLDRGDVWLLWDDGELIGTVTVETVGDKDFWAAEELAETAAYVSKLAIRRDRKGAELGRLLLDWASDHAYRYGCDWLRLDAWRSNERLHSYYSERGWTYLRTVEKAGRHSGTLFQKRTKPMSAESRESLKEVPGIPEVESSFRVPPLPQDPAGNWQPSHMHYCRDLTVDYPNLGPRHLWAVPGYRYRLSYAGDQWTVFVSRPGENWSNEGALSVSTMTLETDTHYVLTHADGVECSFKIAQFQDGGPLTTPQA